MTLSKIIENFDDERTNSVSLERKIRWIDELDKKIWAEILKVRGDKSFNGYSADTSLETVVKAPDEYSEIYTFYLNMKLDCQNGEIARFNNSASLFNRMFKEMYDFINRNQKIPDNTEIKAGKYDV